MKTHSTPLQDLLLLEFDQFVDNRGSFYRLFCDRELREVLGGAPIAQVNHSKTVTPGSLRGLHLQHPPSADIKIVRCIKGKVFDVAVDLRSGSESLLAWHGIHLSADDNLAIVIPKGFAHGFQTTDPDSELLYLHTAHYDPASEAGFRYDDPLMGIDWPLQVSEISDRDRTHALLEPEFTGISV